MKGGGRSEDVTPGKKRVDKRTHRFNGEKEGLDSDRGDRGELYGGKMLGKRV